MVMTWLSIDDHRSADACRPIMRPRAAVGPALLLPQRSDPHPPGLPPPMHPRPRGLRHAGGHVQSS